MSVKSEDTRLISSELNIFGRLNSLSGPLVDLTESHSDTESEQESDKFTEYDPQIVTQRPETELSSLGFSMPLSKGRGQNNHKTTVASNSPDESSQVGSKVRGELEGYWKITRELLNAQLSQGLKISPHPASSENRSLVGTSSLSASGDRPASFFQGNISCSSSEQLGTKQENSLSFCLTNHPKQPPVSGHARPDANSEWQSKNVQAKDSSDLCEHLYYDTTAQPQLSTSDINDTDHRSLTRESVLDLEESSYFFWQDANCDEQYSEESRFESDPSSPSLDGAAFVCPAALNKLMSGQAQTLVREVVHLFRCIFLHLVM